MKLSNFRKEQNGERVRAVAQVTWEDCAFPAREIYFETEAEFADSLSCDANAFVIAAAVPAMRFGEKRLAIDAAICPRLYQDIGLALSWLRHWYGAPRSNIRIEPRNGCLAPLPPATPRSGFFFSGGVDSLAMLRANRLSIPLDHPRSFRDGILVYGFDLGFVPDFAARDQQVFAAARRGLQIIAKNAKIDLVPVYTNIRLLEHGFNFWVTEYLGAALASIAVALSPRLGNVSIGSSGWIGYLQPFGSNPQIDPYFGTLGVSIHHEQTTLGRFEKVKLVADWPIALENLRICFNYPLPPGQLNCSACRKCLLTMLQLLAVDKLNQAPTFSVDNVTSEMACNLASLDENYVGHCKLLIEPLEAIGRHDLARVVRSKVRRYGSRRARFGRHLFREIKQFDELWLNNWLRKLWTR